MTKQEMKSLERDLLLIQRTRSELADKARKILEQVDTMSPFCQTVSLLIIDLKRKIDASGTVKKAAPKKKKK